MDLARVADLVVLHHHRNAADGADVDCRIAIDDDEVGRLAARIDKLLGANLTRVFADAWGPA
jgi:hypothetical protein